MIITGRLCCHSSSSWGGDGDGEPEFSAERVVRDVEDQLALLDADYFDGMLIHDPPRMQPTLAKDGTLAGLLGLKARGLVRNVGYGMRPHEFHRQAIATGDVDFLLCFNDYHLLRQTAAEGVLPAADAAGVGVMNGWSILRGLFTGVDIDQASKLGGYRNEADLGPARERWQWCRDHGVDLLQLALQFCLREPRIHGNPIGSLNAAQLEAQHPCCKHAAGAKRCGPSTRTAFPTQITTPSVRCTAPTVFLILRTRSRSELVAPWLRWRSSAVRRSRWNEHIWRNTAAEETPKSTANPQASRSSVVLPML